MKNLFTIFGLIFLVATKSFAGAGLVTGTLSAYPLGGSGATNGLAGTNYVNNATNNFNNGLLSQPFFFGAYTNSTFTLPTNVFQQVYVNPIISSNIVYTTNGGFTIPSSGIYHLDGNFKFSANGSPAVIIGIFINGSQFISFQNNNVTVNASLPFSTTLYLNTGDIVTTSIFQNQQAGYMGGNIPYPTTLSLYKVR